MLTTMLEKHSWNVNTIHNHYACFCVCVVRFICGGWRWWWFCDAIVEPCIYFAFINIMSLYSTLQWKKNSFSIFAVVNQFWNCTILLYCISKEFKGFWHWYVAKKIFIMLFLWTVFEYNVCAVYMYCTYVCIYM